MKLRLLLINRPRENERLSWPCWLTYSRRFTHINDYPSAADTVQTSESSPVRDRRSITEPPNQCTMPSSSDDCLLWSPALAIARARLTIIFYGCFFLSPHFLRRRKTDIPKTFPHYVALVFNRTFAIAILQSAP